MRPKSVLLLALLAAGVVEAWWPLCRFGRGYKGALLVRNDSLGTIASKLQAQGTLGF